MTSMSMTPFVVLHTQTFATVIHQLGAEVPCRFARLASQESLGLLRRGL